MKTFKELKRNLKKDFSSLKKIKIALLGDTATQFLNQAIRSTGHDENLDLEIWEADFNQIELQVFDPESELYNFKPDIIILYQSSHKLLNRYNKLKTENCNRLAEFQLAELSKICNTINGKLPSRIICYNYAEIDDSIFGNYSSKVEHSFLFQLRKLNYELMLASAANPNLYICDLSSVQNLVGKNQTFSTTVYINTEMVLSIDVLPMLAARTTSIIGSLYGKFNKCLIVDLDNTLWGGIIGDDGIENIQIGALGIGKAFTEFQYWVKKLKNRGIIIAVCSKNTESVAREPFEKHPDMVLKIDDISVFMANWDNKADNIREIQRILNIGFDSMVFLDDNPVERKIVRENIPEVSVPELPEDPADYLEYLYSLNLFETISYSGDDLERTKKYQIEAQRNTLKVSFTNEGDFLKSLTMQSTVEPFTKFNAPRAAQLSQRSNQFNLRTVRYNEQDIEGLIRQEGVFTFTFTLEDQFGDNGLISVVILRKENETTLFIDTWLMSCRVLKRGMEIFMLNTLVASAIENGFSSLKGEYIPTVKNEMVKDFYETLGFYKAGDHWLLNVNSYENQNCFIEVNS